MTIRQNLERALHAAEQGALVLTSNTRAARNLKREYADRQKSTGLEVWKSPDILPWSAWLQRLWQEQIYRGSGAFTALLDEAQERIVWERIISAEPGALDAVSLTQECARAWRLLHAYRVPRERALFGRKKDTAAFFGWAATYSSQCNKNGWLDEARLSDATRGTAAAACAGRKVVLWGFDHFTPQQQDLLDVLQTADVICEKLHADGEPAAAKGLSQDDTQAELRAAAQWARGVLERSPETSIGIVVPNLDEIRGTVERILLEVLHPDALTIEGADGRRAFDISLGVPLADTPVIGAALMLLEIAAGSVSLEKASRLLRSSFIGNVSELGTRCLLDAQIRTEGPGEISLDTLDHWANEKTECPQFAGSVRRLKNVAAKLPKRQMASRWSREILELLRSAGWPGTRTETSREHQARQAFADLLGKFARYDLVLNSMEFPAMFRRLSALAQETLFQPENLGAPVQVVGLLEAAGSHFDHLWVLGMHADAWPPSPNPSPFLPLESQRTAGVTGASGEERLHYAQQVTERFLSSAPDVIFSSPKRQGDRELTVSPLIAEFPPINHEALGASVHRATAEELFAARAQFSLADDTGPLLSEPRSGGGTRIFQLQAACPFRAFAELRLRAKELEIPAPGMDRRLRGRLLHVSLELTWNELQSSKCLLAKDKAELEGIVRRCVDRAVNESDAASFTGWERQVAEIERQRLTQLVLDELAKELERDTPFHLHEAEEWKDVEFGGVATKVKVDRVDELEDGRYVLLDYKSGQPKVASWDSARPDEPQLPIYATRLKDRLAAVAFVQIAKGDICFKGYAKVDHLLPKLKAFDSLTESKRPQPTWDEMLGSWEETLHRLGRNYRDGRAEVDPKKPTTCDHCHLSMMCRIDEAPPAPDGEDNDG